MQYFFYSKNGNIKDVIHASSITGFVAAASQGNTNAVSAGATTAGAGYSEQETKDIGTKIVIPNADGVPGLIEIDWILGTNGLYTVDSSPTF